MRVHHRVGLAVALLLTWGVAPAGAQAPGDPLPGGFPMIVVVDEYCSGSVSMDGGDTFFPLHCFLQFDDCVHDLVPCFILPQPVFAGDVIGTEVTGAFSEMLRFLDQGDGTAVLLCFYSDKEPDNPDPAPSDVGLPPRECYQPVVVFVPEQGVPEVFDYVLWGTPSAVYLAISDYPIMGASNADLAELVQLLRDRGPKPAK
jgi:hypothetical protein